MLWHCPLKGTVSRDFSCPVSSFKQLLLVPLGMPKEISIFSNIRGVIRIRSRLPGDEYTISRLESFRQILQT
jgi:hypothetical protein